MSKNALFAKSSRSQWVKGYWTLRGFFYTILAFFEHFSETESIKDDFQSVLCSVRTLMFINIINGSLDGMRINVIRYEPHTLSLRPFKFFFQQLHWFLQLCSYFMKWYEKEWSIKLQPLRIHNGVCFLTLNLLHVSSCEMFTFCDVLREAKQKNINKLSRVRSIDWKSALSIIQAF